MAQTSKESFKITTLKVMGLTYGLMSENLWANGKRIRWKEEDFLLGLMAEYTAENTKKTRSMDMENSVGLMEGNIQVNGLMGNNMVKELI
jgi:hypothetical protein